MEEFLSSQGVLQALRAMTAVGALPILFTKEDRGVRDLALGFAAGVMLAASLLTDHALRSLGLRYGGTWYLLHCLCGHLARDWNGRTTERLYLRH